MRRLTFVPLLALAVGLIFTPAPRAADDDAVLADELVLKNSYLATDGKSLVAFLSTRAKGEVTADRLKELIDALSAKTAAERQKACAELVSIGSPAIPSLRRVARSVDNSEAAALAQRCLRALEEDNAPLTSAAVRILAARRPEGTAKALLAYLPHAENESVAEELRTALAGVAYVQGSPDKDVLGALEDEHPIRRAAAVIALCSRGIPPQKEREKVRKLLSDTAPSVRLRAAMALAQASDSKAVSTLILLLADLPHNQAAEVESALVELAGDLAPKNATLGADQLSRDKARDAWAKWWIDTEGDSLLKELEKRTLTEKDMTEATGHIEKLGDDAFAVRQKAEAALKKMGSNIIPLLKTAQKSDDLEIRNRSTKILEILEANKPAPLSGTTPKLIALRKPAGSAEAIFAYMPFIEEEAMFDEMQAALNAVAFANGKANPVLVKGVNDKNAIRRAAAGVALASGPLADHMPALRKLLKDKDNEVRLKVALALATAREPESVPTLITLVGEHNAEGSAAAEEYLLKLAGSAPPKGLPEGDDQRKKRADLWSKWYDANKKTLVMADRKEQMRERYLGFVVLCQPNNGAVVEYDKNRKERWRITGLSNPWDAQVLANNRVLITEYGTRRVTERDFKGKILWEKSLGNFYPLMAERLRNGNTFIVGNNFMMEVDKKGKEVFRMDRNQYDIRSARKLPNGDIVMISSNRNLIRFDAKGKEKSNVILAQYPQYNQNDILNNGNVLISQGWNGNAVFEYDSKGKEVAKFTSVMTPMFAHRMPNGHTLIISQQGNYPIYEVDKKGKQVGQAWNTNTYTYRLRTR